MKIITISLIILSGFLLSGCILTKWQGFYYPNGCLSCDSQYIYSPIFNDLDTCMAWGEDLKEERGNPNDTFECGKNCKLKSGGMYLCSETVD